MFKLNWKFFRKKTVIRSFNRREEEGFVQIVDSCYYALFHFACRLLNEKKDAEGIIERTFVIIWDSKKEWKSIPELKRDLFRTTQSLCIARLMKHDKWDKEIKKRSFFHEYIRSHVFKNVKETLDNMPEQYHHIFLFRFVWRKELNVIVDILGMPIEMVIEIQSKIQSILYNKYSRKRKN